MGFEPNMVSGNLQESRIAEINNSFSKIQIIKEELEDYNAKVEILKKFARELSSNLSFPIFISLSKDLEKQNMNFHEKVLNFEKLVKFIVGNLELKNRRCHIIISGSEESGSSKIIINLTDFERQNALVFSSLGKSSWENSGKNFGNKPLWDRSMKIQKLIDPEFKLENFGILFENVDSIKILLNNWREYKEAETRIIYFSKINLPRFHHLKTNLEIEESSESEDDGIIHTLKYEENEYIKGK